MPSKITAQAQANWDNHIKNYLLSGLSIKQYCQNQKLVYHRFKYQWGRYRRQQKKPDASQTTAPQVFTKVQLQAAPSLSGHDHYELRCPNGVCCRLPIDLNKTKALKILEGLLS